MYSGNPNIRALPVTATWANQPAPPTSAPHTKPPTPAAGAPDQPTSRRPRSVSASSSLGTPSRRASAS
jgi:hypothetical protein